jgi:hypothetical protein
LPPEKLIEQAVRERGQTAKPTVSVLNDQLRISWGENAGVTAMLCWLQPDVMTAALSAELVEVPGAMSAQERFKRVGEAEQTLLALERREVGLIECARESGIEILYRPDTDARAVLNIAITQAAQQAAQQVA